MSDITVSIIIPCYNAEKYIQETVASCLDQTHAGIEVIVVDDGSKDQSVAILKTIQDKRLLLHTQRNQGESVARNKGASLASGTYLMFLDSDDVLHPEAVANLFQQIISASPDTIIYGQRVVFNDGKDFRKLQTKEETQPEHMLAFFIKGGKMIPGQYMISKENFKTLGGYSEDIQFGEDWEFVLKAADRFAFQFIPKVCLYKRTHPNMQTLTGAKNIDMLEQAHFIYKRAFGEQWNQYKQKYLHPSDIANWYRSYGFQHYKSSKDLNARKAIIRSLQIWPWQPKLWLWVSVQTIKGILGKA